MLFLSVVNFIVNLYHNNIAAAFSWKTAAIHAHNIHKNADAGRSWSSLSSSVRIISSDIIETEQCKKVNNEDDRRTALLL